MISIPRLKALVIDDQPSEALAALQALQLLGIGGLFYDGGIDNPFGDKLPAPQLLFLDMVLGEHGADVNDEAGCRQLVFQAIENITQLGSAPLVVVCWSGHQNHFENFQNEFSVRFTDVGKVVFLRADKADFFRPADPTALARLRDHIGNGLKELGVLGLLFEWELLVAEAAALTVQRLTVVANNFKKLDAKPELGTETLDEICGLLALAEGGVRIIGGKVDSVDCIFDLFRVLQSLLLDRLEHQMPSGNLTPAYGARLKAATLRAKAAKESHFRSRRDATKCDDEMFAIWQSLGCDIAAGCACADGDSGAPVHKPLHELVIELNTMLLMAKDGDGKTATPGTLYFLGETAGKVESLPPGGIARKKVIADTFRGSERGTEQVVLLECTPSCDFSQNKRRLPRLVAGVLVEVDRARQLPSQAEFLRQVGPIQLNITNSSSPCMLVLNGHFVSGVAQEEFAKLVSVGRLRIPVLADITSWLGHQMARPGYVSL